MKPLNSYNKFLPKGKAPDLNKRRVNKSFDLRDQARQLKKLNRNRDILQVLNSNFAKQIRIEYQQSKAILCSLRVKLILSHS